MNETKNPTQEAFDRLYHQFVDERLQMKEGFTIAKEELISATPELRELAEYLASIAAPKKQESTRMRRRKCEVHDYLMGDGRCSCHERR